MTGLNTAEFEVFVKLLGGRVVYDASTMCVTVGFKIPGGRVALTQVSLDMPLDEAKQLLIDAANYGQPGVQSG